MQILVHLRLGSTALCGVAGPMPGTRDASAVTCAVCNTLIAASGLFRKASAAPECLRREPVRAAHDSGRSALRDRPL